MSALSPLVKIWKFWYIVFLSFQVYFSVVTLTKLLLWRRYIPLAHARLYIRYWRDRLLKKGKRWKIWKSPIHNRAIQIITPRLDTAFRYVSSYLKLYFTYVRRVDFLTIWRQNRINRYRYIYVCWSDPQNLNNKALSIEVFVCRMQKIRRARARQIFITQQIHE